MRPLGTCFPWAVFLKITEVDHVLGYFFHGSVYALSLTKMSRVRIQKPVVTYDSGKFSVTSCARLPNYFKINLQDNFYMFLKLLFNWFGSQILYFHFKNYICNV
jgi:hypothetical protein